MSTPRAFVVEPTNRYDVSPTQRYGAVTYVFTGAQRRASIWNTSRMTTEIIDRLEEMSFDPQTDYVVLAGSYLSVSIFVCAAVSRYGQVRALAFNASSDVRDYDAILLGGREDERAESRERELVSHASRVTVP